MSPTRFEPDTACSTTNGNTMARTVTVAPDYHSLCVRVADRITTLLQDKPSATLGLATGSTPLGVYQILVQRYRQQLIDFSQVTCFNLDEYYPILPSSPHSYHHFMHHHFFQHVNCKHWFVPDGSPRTPDRIEQGCRDYEAGIEEAGGLDLQLLGIGRTGHLGFNEPGSLPDSRTRLVSLAAETREDAAASFGGISLVPEQAVSMGLGTILGARSLVLMASGGGKASIVSRAWTGEVGVSVPASWVQGHPDVHLCLDKDAAALLP